MQNNLENLFNTLEDLYSKMPNSVGCISCGKCCKVQHPHCYKIEFYNILRGISDWSIEDRENLHMACISNYLNNSMNKQCVFLDNKNKCKIYNYRDYNCRAFGIIPKKAYAKRVKSVKKRFPGIRLGLEKQSDCCGDIHPETYIGQKKLDEIFKSICDLDKMIGVEEIDIKEGNNYMTFHDHYLLFYYKDNIEFLKQLTWIKYNYSDSEKKSFLNLMKESLSKGIINNG